MKSVHVKSYGCSANVGEGEVMKGLLKEADYKISEQEEADIIVVNVCTVKGNKPTLKEIKKTKGLHPNKKLVITGCVTPELVPLIKEIDPQASIMTTHAIKKIVPAVSQTLHHIQFKDLSRPKVEKINTPRVRNNPVVGIVPICSGCLDACSFCSTKLVKGHLYSYPIQAIVKDVTQLVQDGCKEIWLTGQDTACYGFDLNTDITELLQELVKIEGNFWIRVGMGNPRHVLKYIDKLTEIMQHEKIFKFIHLPVQAGNDEVLKGMNRKHSVDDFVVLVEKLRKAIPEITISTDIICGFPGETEEQFRDTVQLVDSMKPATVNVSRFQARKGTRAATMPEQIHGRISKDRSRVISHLWRSNARELNKKWIGWKGTILINEKGIVPGSWVGRNYAYKPIALKGEYRIGQRVEVVIKDATKFTLYANAL